MDLFSILVKGFRPLHNELQGAPCCLLRGSYICLCILLLLLLLLSLLLLLFQKFSILQWQILYRFLPIK